MNDKKPSFAPRDAELLQRNLHKLNEEPFKEIALDADDIGAMRKWWDVSPYKEGDVTDARIRNGVWEFLRTAQQSAAAAKAERRAAKREKAERAAEALKAATARRAAVPSYHKRSPNWWRETLAPIMKHSSLTLDQQVEHFVDLEDEFAESFERRKGNAVRMLFDALVSTHLFLLLAREKRVQLESRVAELEQRRVPEYRGVWKHGTPYARGSMVTCSGCLWHCNEDGSVDKPGGSDAWTLCVKRGRDGRDGKANDNE